MQDPHQQVQHIGLPYVWHECLDELTQLPMVQVPFLATVERIKQLTCPNLNR